ncbi:MAG: DUF1232 domain-containing protein [Elusimicrobia bacterium]|nr:DUF1232 domain-containing protein [Elusimicrobiota bacterium]
MVGKLFTSLRPKTQAVLLAVACLLYVLSPIDCVPDVTPVIGWLDDLLVVVATAIGLWRRLKKMRLPSKEDPQ